MSNQVVCLTSLWWPEERNFNAVSHKPTPNQPHAPENRANLNTGKLLYIFDGTRINLFITRRAYVAWVGRCTCIFYGLVKYCITLLWCTMECHSQHCPTLLANAAWENYKTSRLAQILIFASFISYCENYGRACFIFHFAFLHWCKLKINDFKIGLLSAYLNEVLFSIT